MKMYPLDFEEFLWAKGYTPSLIKELYNFFITQTPVPLSIHNNMMKVFREYIAVGGMPEVVVTHLENPLNYLKVDYAQRKCLDHIQNAISYYTDGNKIEKSLKVYNSLSYQLLEKGNPKFQYTIVEKGGKGRKFSDSVLSLSSLSFINLSHNVQELNSNLEDYKELSNFRAYPCDISMLVATKDFSFKQMIIEDTLPPLIKKRLYKCAIGDILLKKRLPLYFYKNETTKKEIDFLIQREGHIVPIEVKSSNERATSLNWLMEKKPNIPIAYKLIDGNIGMGDEKILTIPLYMAMFL